MTIQITLDHDQHFALRQLIKEVQKAPKTPNGNIFIFESVNGPTFFVSDDTIEALSEIEEKIKNKLPLKNR